jgi:hypothetical protein
MVAKAKRTAPTKHYQDYTISNEAEARHRCSGAECFKHVEISSYEATLRLH